MTPTRDQVLAASAGWVAVVLNVVPGLGAGYLYQRRWKAYWITSLLATTWFVVEAVLAQNSAAEAQPQNQLVGLIGLIGLAVMTSAEAGLAVKAVRQDSCWKPARMRCSASGFKTVARTNGFAKMLTLTPRCSTASESSHVQH